MTNTINSVPATMLLHEGRARADGFDLIIGIDEAGRGPLAGPVVAAAVRVNDPCFSRVVTDSKALTAKQREAALEEILLKCDFGIGLVTESVIDEKNILNATFLAMKQAILDLEDQIGFSNHKVCLLVDGNRFHCDLPYAARTIIGGDGLSLSIACASIIAKVTRDRLLDAYDRVFPEYGFAKHKGYPTREHRQAIAKHGLSPIHRRTFRYDSPA